jgi:hypothetical protein
MVAVPRQVYRDADAFVIAAAVGADQLLTAKVIEVPQACCDRCVSIDCARCEIGEVSLGQLTPKGHDRTRPSSTTVL